MCKTNLKSAANLLAAVLPLLFCACGNPADNAGEKKAPQVVFAHPKVEDVVLWDEYTAKLEAVASVDIRAQVGGYLKSINFKEGQ